MDTFELSPIARRRLWQCYLLLLELAEEAEEDAVLDSELDENHDEETIGQTDEVTQLSSEQLESAPEQGKE